MLVFVNNALFTLSLLCEKQSIHNIKFAYNEAIFTIFSKSTKLYSQLPFGGEKRYSQIIHDKPGSIHKNYQSYITAVFT